MSEKVAASDGPELRLRVLAETVKSATGHNYQPLKTTQLLLDAALGDEQVVHAFGAMKSDGDGWTYTGELALFSKTFVVHAALTRMGSEPMPSGEGDADVRSVPRRALRAVHLRAPARKYAGFGDAAAQALPYDVAVIATYDGLDQPLVLPSRFDDRPLLLKLLYADLRA